MKTKEKRISYSQKGNNAIIYAEGIIDTVDISYQELDYFERDVLLQFDLPALSERELVALTLNLINQIEATTGTLKELDWDDDDLNYYLEDYENEKTSYQVLVNEWARREIIVPRNAEEFDSVQIERKQSDAQLFKLLLIASLKEKSVNFKAERIQEEQEKEASSSASIGKI
ncbi:hypothetical protein ACFO26_05925 [Lactococcus nasutitermitis]|uniref:Uncharacterized protein n=1 Tax=Lactococcus nasutitermitis TaxID=1652957 RepID=A0ABV9JCH0_9LACT|nr:hypothetical protein [Lactococcus nasutitermitis]